MSSFKPRIKSLLAGIALTALTAVSAFAEPRLALIIGNGDYKTFGDLANPATDAQDIAKLINTAGFEAMIGTDLPLTDMRELVNDFLVRAKEKGPDVTLLIFFAGHGLQIDGENYLVPTDADIATEEDVKAKTLALSELVKQLYSVPGGARIIMLDSCRNNPFKGTEKIAGTGLVLVDAPEGSVISYSTSPGSVALDGDGIHSPYADALLGTIREPGLDLDDLLRKVRVRVHKATDGKQTPWESWALKSNFEFFAELAVANAVAAPAPEAKVVKIATVEDLKALPANQAYDAVIAEDRVDYYQEFVRLYPDDPLVDRVRRIIQRRRQAIDWQQATHANNAEAYDRYIDRHPNSIFSFNANRLRERPRTASIEPLFSKGLGGNGNGNGSGNGLGNGLGNGAGGFKRIDLGRLPTNIGSAAGTGFGGNRVVNTGPIRAGGINVGNVTPNNGGFNGGRPIGTVGQGGAPVNTGINGGNIKTGPVVPVNGTSGINPNGGRPVINTPVNAGGANGGINPGNIKTGPVVTAPGNGTPANGGINPGSIKTAPVTTPTNTGINPNGGRPVINTTPQNTTPVNTGVVRQANNNATGGIVNRAPIQNQNIQVNRAPIQQNIQRAPVQNIQPRVIQQAPRFTQVQRAPVQNFSQRSFSAPRASFGGGGGGGGFGRRR